MLSLRRQSYEIETIFELNFESENCGRRRTCKIFEKGQLVNNFPHFKWKKKNFTKALSLCLSVSRHRHRRWWETRIFKCMFNTQWPNAQLFPFQFSSVDGSECTRKQLNYQINLVNRNDPIYINRKQNSNTKRSPHCCLWMRVRVIWYIPKR